MERVKRRHALYAVAGSTLSFVLPACEVLGHNSKPALLQSLLSTNNGS